MIALLLLSGMGLLMGISPWFVLKREFGGAAVLATPFSLVDPQQLGIPESLSLTTLPVLCVGVWILLLLAWGCRWLPNAQQRYQWLMCLGWISLILTMIVAGAFWHQIHEINAAALAAGIAPSRLPLRRSSLSLGWILLLITSVGLLLWGRWQKPGLLGVLVRYRAVIVPLVSMGIAVLLGGIMVWGLRPGLGTENVETLSGWTIGVTKLDLVTYTFQLLFSPITQLPGLFQSLLLATPLIFTGLAVALGFHAGLFNIGAPGQLTMGAIATMLVGVYCPGPRWLVLPLAILAAAAGGALWGVIPGWLKARFGTHEVINTIMLNYIAASLFLFLLAGNDYQFFGFNVYLPFKAAGGEARSAEIQATAQLPLLLRWLGVDSTAGLVTWGIPLAAVATVLVVWILRRRPLGQRLWSVGAAILGGYVVGGLIPAIAVTIPPALTSVRLNGAFVLALVALGLVTVYLWRTQGGYELRAMGLSPQAAAYAGVNLPRQVILVMALSGALAGLAATHYVLGGGIDEYRLKQSLPVSVGFDGIAVALMGQNHPIGISLTALLFGILLTGGLQLNLELGISRELVTALQALIVLLIAAGGFLPRYFSDPLRAAQVEIEATALEKETLENQNRAG